MVIFVSLALAGFFLVFVMAIFGGDADFGELDGDIGDVEHGGAGVLNLKVLSLAVCGWGVAGGLARYAGYDMVASSLFGLVGAGVLGGVGLLVLNVFYKSQTPFIIRDADYSGVTGRTLFDIPKGGIGQMMCTIKGVSKTVMAKEAKGGKIPKDSVVEIVDMQGGVALVRLKVDDDAKEETKSEE